MVDRDVRRTRRVVVRHAVEPATRTGIPTSRNAGERLPATAPGELAAPAGDGHPPQAVDDHLAAPVNPVRSAPPTLGPLRGPQLPDGFEAALAGQGAEAAQLRAQVDELRRRLDAPLPPLRPAGGRRRRGPLLSLLVVGGTVGVIATATLVPWSDLDLTGGPSTATPAPAAAPRIAAPAPAAEPAPALTPVRVAGLPATGPGVDQPGTAILVRLGRDGTLRVTEAAVLGPRGVRTLDLAFPSLAELGGRAAQLKLQVSSLSVKVNGAPASATRNAAGTGWTVDLGTARARQVELTYRVRGSMIASRAGHGLAVVQPLLAQTLRAQGLPLVVHARGAVTGITCPGAGTAMLCGSQVENGWDATVPAEATSPATLLQLSW